MTREIARRRSLSLGLAALGLLASGCATVVEVPVETPLSSKIDVSRFRRVLVAGASAVIQQLQRGRGRPSPWLLALLKRKPA